MKIRKFAAALLALVLCLSLSLPAAFAEAQQRVELKNLTVNVKCTGNAIPDEQLTIRLTPRKKSPHARRCRRTGSVRQHGGLHPFQRLYDHRHIPGDIRLHGPRYL